MCYVQESVVGVTIPLHACCRTPCRWIACAYISSVAKFDPVLRPLKRAQEQL